MFHWSYCLGVMLEAVGSIPCELVANIEKAVQLAAEHAVSGDTVLLSPACASLDQFASYQQRGEHFMTAVEALER